jgi:hypothetical protein
VTEPATPLRLDQAAARLDPVMIETFAKAAYEGSRPPGSGRPPWEACTEEWRAAVRRETVAGFAAIAARGWTVTKP